MDHLPLENIVKEDKFTRLPQPYHGLSFVWALLDPAFGMHGVRRQYESLCLGGRFKPGKNTDVWDATEPRNVMKLLESVVAANVAPQVQAPKRRDFRPSTEVKPVVKDLAYVADAAPSSVKMSKDGLWTNKQSVTFYPHSPRSPFLVEVKEFPLAGADPNFQKTHAVSVSWVLRQYHPKFLAMAREELWRPECFSENAEGGMPGFKYVDPLDGDPVHKWKHGEKNLEVKCGAPPGSNVAGCIRDALAVALRVYSPLDSAVHAEIQTWKEWVDWPKLPGQVASLNQVSAFGNVHNLLTLEDCLKLPMTRLGRSKLFAAAFRSLLLRPMALSDG